MVAKRLTVAQRKEIFRELVEIQDSLQDVRKSRQIIMEKHRITDRQLRKIEDEGIRRQWPPLDLDN
ncbi:MAG: hypothetical protein RMJ19_11420 [Gemmatales bacterium]|nr:hypothetical protein [Gemmatales bacterium]MCS7161071.1 hypothetical protein [Gemmatales bacterium]MDW8176274.1 hypothetical protein [Gemmatales bacterium]MDW8223286.1 hypothetical protein [Gemmatales bacterium]